ncbi:MAG TPA: hypothetical protein VFI91_14015 [Longimicrobiaceae bacterium]|nr:hypothetical protein [Longimicrobiaceae bacterium]
MEHRQIRMQQIHRVPRHAARELSGGEWIALTVVALAGLTGTVGTLVTAWWLLLT